MVSVRSDSAGYSWSRQAQPAGLEAEASFEVLDKTLEKRSPPMRQ